MIALLQAIPVLAGLLVALIQLWNARAPQRAQEAINDAQARGRQDVVDGDADSVAVRIDGLLSSGDCDAGSQSGTSDAGPASIDDRLANIGISVDKAS